MWSVPELDEEYTERMEDVLELYTREYDPSEPVLCMDEKSVQLLAHTRDVLPPKPGKVRKVDHEYVRCGTANIFACFEPKRGALQVTERRTALDFAFFLAYIATLYPDATKIHLVMGNLNTHCEKSLIQAFGLRQGRALWRKFTVHYTPKHASWLNQAELLLSAVSRAALRKTRHETKRKLQKTLTAWTKNNKNFVTSWKFSVADAQRKFKYKKKT
jgi:hypothetical protein